MLPAVHTPQMTVGLRVRSEWQQLTSQVLTLHSTVVTSTAPTAHNLVMLAIQGSHIPQQDTLPHP